MRSTEIDRRRFLGLLLAASLPSMAAAVVSRKGEQPLYLAARQRAGRYEAVVFDDIGIDVHVVPLPDRGHSFAIDAVRGRAVAFGRQPGFFAVAFDLKGQGEPQLLEPVKGRHYFGHGVYASDGSRLYATENDYEAGRGVLGIYDVAQTGAYRRIGEYSTAGIGPHEVIMMPDGRTLCVANGGILTHPDYGKLALNLDTMKPSLAYIDADSGRLLEQVLLPETLHCLSLRHLALDASGAVWVGCQYMGPAGNWPPLVVRHQRGERARLLSGPQEVLRDMRNYVGSVAADASGRVIATSSPVGNCVVFWDAIEGRFLDQLALNDGCGVAPADGRGFMLSSGQGALVGVELAGGKNTLPGKAAPGLATPNIILPAQPALAWDNHMRKV